MSETIVRSVAIENAACSIQARSFFPPGLEAVSA